MSSALDEHQDVIERLRSLALAAAPATPARPDIADEVLRISRTQRTHRRRWALTAVGGLAVAGVVAAAALPGQGSYFSQYQPSGIMEPTVMVGEQLITGKELQPQRGDVIVFHFTYDGADLDVIQRVVGLPGDLVACPAAGDSNRCDELVVNGRSLPEPYVNGSAGVAFPETEVPAGKVYVLGDNRDAAIDSRTIGPVQLDQVRGVGVRITSAAGVDRRIIGAPTRPGPDDSDVTDPRQTAPESEDSPA